MRSTIPGPGIHVSAPMSHAGKPFNASPIRVKAQPKLYCSKPCSLLAQPKAATGE